MGKSKRKNKADDLREFKSNSKGNAEKQSKDADYKLKMEMINVKLRKVEQRLLLHRNRDKEYWLLMIEDEELKEEKWLLEEEELKREIADLERVRNILEKEKNKGNNTKKLKNKLEKNAKDLEERYKWLDNALGDLR